MQLQRKAGFRPSELPGLRKLRPGYLLNGIGSEVRPKELVGSGQGRSVQAGYWLPDCECRCFHATGQTVTKPSRMAYLVSSAMPRTPSLRMMLRR